MYLDEMEREQKVIDAQQQVNKAIDTVVDMALEEMADWLQLVKDINNDDNRFEELEFKMNIREAAERLREDIKTLVDASKEDARWTEEMGTIIETSLDSRDVCLKYDLKPSELLQHQEDGLKSFQQNGEKMFRLQDCIDYFDE